MKIVINTIHGGFSVSHHAALWMYERNKDYPKTTVEKYFGEDNGKFGLKASLERWRNLDKTFKTPVFMNVFSPDEKYVLEIQDLKRDDPLLIRCIEELGPLANGSYANLKIVEIPDDVEWDIKEYDGLEHIAEKHRTWS